MNKELIERINAELKRFYAESGSMFGPRLEPNLHYAGIISLLQDCKAALTQQQERAPMSEIVQRVLSYAGKRRNQVSNPCITARQCIELANYIASLTQQQEAEPYGYLRENDGAIQISIGPERPADRSGGYATPWVAIYARPPKPAVERIVAAKEGGE